MFFTGQPLSAADLAAAGGAIITCPPDELLNRARAFAERIAGFSPTASRLGKRILNQIEEMELQPGYAFEQRYTVIMSGHPDAKEALNAVREKRLASYPPAGIAAVAF
jgi:enoyl-CoA hydratase/carnithine racemase